MTIEHPGRRELAELVANHFLVHQDRNVFLAVVDTEIQPDKLRKYCRAPAPYFDHLVTTRSARGFLLAQQIAIDKGTFPNRTRHSSCPTAASFCGRGGLPR